MANAPSRLKNLDNERFGRPVKTSQDAISAALTLSTAYQDFITYAGGVEVANGGAWLDIGNAPGLDVLIEYTHSTSTTLSILALFANPTGGDATVEPTIFAPPPYIPSDTDGTTPAFVNELSFSKNDWTTTTSPGSSATVKYLRAYLVANGRRLVKLMGLANSAAGTAKVYVCAGTIG